MVFDPQSGLAVDVFPCEDGHAQERSLLTAVAATIQARDVSVMDRNFCVLKFLFNFHKKSAFFVARQHGNTPYKPLTELEFIAILSELWNRHGRTTPALRATPPWQGGEFPQPA